MQTRQLNEIPPVTSLYVKAAAAALRSGDEMPESALTVRGVSVDADRVARYDRLCGFAFSDRLPVTYPYLLAFPLSLELMASPTFPFALPGLVHITNSIRQHRPIRLYEALDVTVWIGDLRPHRSGQQFDVHGTVEARGETVWESTSTYFARGDGDPDAPEPDADPGRFSPPHTATWRVPKETGRRYGAVSGDRNPIHLYALTAKVFGFPRAIAHGMWTKARSLAALESVLPDAFTVDVAWRKPLLLPSTVDFASEEHGDGYRFEVRSSADIPHLHGRITKK